MLDFYFEKCKHPTMAHRPKLLLKQFSCAAVEKENKLTVSCKESGHLLTADADLWSLRTFYVLT